jgi:hypothetical protein
MANCKTCRWRTVVAKTKSGRARAGPHRCDYPIPDIVFPQSVTRAVGGFYWPPARIGVWDDNGAGCPVWEEAKE